MTVMIQGSQLRTLLQGVRVKTSAKTVPQNAAQSLFNVTGGRVLVTAVYGEVTTVIGGTTPNLKVTYSPTSGTDTDLCTATAITADAVNTHYSLPAAVGTGLQVSANVGHVVANQPPGHLVDTGTIDAHVSAADATGAIEWTLFYVPIDDGAAVSAA